MADKNTPKTNIFQNLGKAVFTGFDKNIEDQMKRVRIYNINPTDTVLHRTNDPVEHENMKMQMRQEKFLANQWVRAGHNLSQNTMLNVTNLQLMYRDCDLMDNYPEIGAALDLVSEETCTTDSKGRMVKIHSNSPRIKNALEDLFVNRLDGHINIPMWTRTMVKYGNCYVLLNITPENGIIGSRQMPVYEMQRVDDGVLNPYVANATFSKSDGRNEFVWVGKNEQTPFQNWQIAHFRLLTDSMYLPYGCLVGDTRVETEYGHKNIEKLQKGDKVWTFDINTQEKILGDVTLMIPKGVQKTYKVKTKHNYIVGTDDHKLLTYDNKQFIYKEIKDLKISDFLVIDNDSNKKYEEIKIDKRDITDSEENFDKSTQWWFNNIKQIPDVVDEAFAKFFGFMIGDGWITRNHVFFATGEYNQFNKEFSDYMEKITNRKTRFLKPFYKENNKYEYSQVVCSSKMLTIILKRMGFNGKFNTKRIPEWVFMASNPIKKAFLNGLMIADGSFNIDEYNCLRCGIEMSNEQLIKDIKLLVQSLGYKSGNISKRDRSNRKRNELKNGRTIQSKNTSYYFFYYESINKQEKKFEIENRLNDGFKVEKIISIEEDEYKNVYDITINNKNANFYANGIITHNCSFLNKARRHWRILSMMEDAMLIYRLERSIERRVFKIYVGAIDDADIPAYVQEIANSFKRTPIIDPATGQLDLRKSSIDVTQDFFIPVKDMSAATPIDVLQPASNLDKIEDLKYIQNKVMVALRVPAEFLNYEQSAGNGKNLALKDIRFTRTVNRIQQAMIMELTKIAQIHLYLLGFTDDLTNFKITMNSPSTQSEILKLEELSKKITLITDAVRDVGNGMQIMSLTMAQREILGWTDEEITENMIQIRLERALASELTKTDQIIKRTGFFDKVDKLYGDINAEYVMDELEGGGGDMGGGGGGGGLGGDDTFGGDEGMGETEDVNIDGAQTTPDMGGGDLPPSNNTEETPITDKPMESFKKNVDKLLIEFKKEQKHVFENRSNTYFESYVKHIKANNNNSEEEVYESTPIFDKAIMINENTMNLVTELENTKVQSIKTTINENSEPIEPVSDETKEILKELVKKTTKKRK